MTNEDIVILSTIKYKFNRGEAFLRSQHFWSPYTTYLQSHIQSPLTENAQAVRQDCKLVAGTNDPEFQLGHDPGLQRHL